MSMSEAAIRPGYAELRQRVRDLTTEWIDADRYTPRSDCWPRAG
jgi:hypothetical protein